MSFSETKDLLNCLAVVNWSQRSVEGFSFEKFPLGRGLILECSVVQRCFSELSRLEVKSCSDCSGGCAISDTEVLPDAAETETKSRPQFSS